MSVSWRNRTINPISDEQFADMIREALRAVASEINPVLNIGITGQRTYPPIQQRGRFSATLTRIALAYPGTVAVHHGCCTGTDEIAHAIAHRIPGCLIYGYPGADKNGRSPHRMQEREGFTTVYPPVLYSDRNLRIVVSSTVLIACPRYAEDDPRSLRSGTWQTIRYARQVKKPIIYVLPNGELYQ